MADDNVNSRALDVLLNTILTAIDRKIAAAETSIRNSILKYKFNGANIAPRSIVDIHFRDRSISLRKLAEDVCPQVIQGYGNVGSAEGFVLSAQVIGMRMAGGLWRIEVRGEIVENAATRTGDGYNLGIALTQIATLLGIPASLVSDSAPAGMLCITDATGMLNAAALGKGGCLALPSTGLLVFAQYTDAQGTCVSLPSQHSAYDVGNIINATFYAREQTGGE